MDPARSNMKLSGPQRPNIKVMAVNLAKTAANVVDTAISNSAIFSDEITSSNRLNICNSCEFLMKEQVRCSKCGCFMKTKVKLIASKCPVNKW